MMEQTVLPKLLFCNIKPMLIKSSLSVCKRECSELLRAPLRQYNVPSNLAFARAYSGGRPNSLPCVEHKHCVQACGTLMVRPSQVVMRTIFTNYSSSSQKKPESSSTESEQRSSSEDQNVPPEKLSLFKRFKQMYRDYWYVLIPVHVVTSVGWFGAFYYMCISGVDVVAALESLNISEKIINPLRDSKAGYVALSYALYKIATPLRYTVTIGGTTVSINYLKKWGYIKPIPPTEKLKEMYDERKENLMERKDALIKETAEQLKERKDSFMKSYRSKQ